MLFTPFLTGHGPDIGAEKPFQGPSHRVPSQRVPLAAEPVRRIDAILPNERGINGPSGTLRCMPRREQVAPLVASREQGMRAERVRLSRPADIAKTFGRYAEAMGHLHRASSQPTAWRRAALAPTGKWHRLPPSAMVPWCGRAGPR